MDLSGLNHKGPELSGYRFNWKEWACSRRTNKRLHVNHQGPWLIDMTVDQKWRKDLIE